MNKTPLLSSLFDLIGTANLDISKNLLVLSLTIVHPIDESSVLHGFDFKDFIEKDVELFILISAYDNTFAQIVHNRYSYLGEDIVNNAKYKRPFYTDEAGNTVLDVAGLGEFELLS